MKILSGVQIFHTLIRVVCIFGLSVPLFGNLQADELSGLRKIRLISEKTAIDINSKSIIIAIDVELEPNWKTYWRSSGQYGLPLEFRIIESTNVLNITPLWPAPTRFVNEKFPFLSMIGYEKRLVLPLIIELTKKGLGAKVKLDVSLGVCRNMCASVDKRIEINLSTGSPKATKEAKLIAISMARVPKRDAVENFKLFAATNKNTPSELRLAVCYFGEDKNPDIFIESSPNVSFVAPLKVVMRQGAFILFAANADKNPTTNPAGAVPQIGSTVTLTFVAEDLLREDKVVVDSDFSVEVQYCSTG
tara:strand:- start:624 stop:1535 length:912 start_codon:yes stop_codon:yes gene_type:complete